MADGKKQAKILTRKSSLIPKRKKNPKSSRGKKSRPPTENSQVAPCEKSPEPTRVKPSAPLHKKSRKPIREKLSAPLLENSPEPTYGTTSEPLLEKSPDPTSEKPSVLLLENSPEKSPPTAPLQKSPKSTLNKALKREDEKYEGINFDAPPSDWSKEDKSKMREIIRSMTLVHKKQTNKDRVSEISKQVRNSGPVEMALAREIIGLLQKDTNLMNHMELKHVAFSTFSKNTYDWDKVAELLDSKHTPAECKEYWYMDLYPRIKNMGFSEANDKQLMELAIENKFQNWDKIADKMIAHTEYQCYVHFRRNLYKKMQQPKNKAKKST